MKRIVECLLEEGIDESMVHRILDLIEEEYTSVEPDSNKSELPPKRKPFVRWRYDTKLYKTKKDALRAVGSKEHYSSPSKYFAEKRSITKEIT